MKEAAARVAEHDASAAIAAIWHRSRDTALARVALLEDAVAALIEGRLSEELRRDAERAAHRLAGSAGTFGFARASESARRLEWTFAGTEQVSRDRVLMAADEVVVLRGDLERDPSPTTAGEPESPAAAAPSTGRLLVAVGEEGRREALVGTAAARGFEAVVVDDPVQPPAGAEACVAALVDLGLPADAGFRLLAQLEGSDPPVPTLALTPSDAFTDRVEAARAGARGFLAATAPPEELLDAVEGLHERTRTADATILVVDDDPTMLEAVGAVLGEAGLRMVGIDDPREFWATINEDAPDLVILDRDMPGVTGDELCRVVRNDPGWAGLPILFLTADSDPETITEVFSAGADDFVSKPFAGPELLARISNRLERTRLFQAFADTDFLTGLANRRRCELDLEFLLGLADRHRQPLSIAMLDLDGFKEVNDRHGHAVGDAVLRRMGSLLAGSFRGEDVVGRWGGEEFVVAMHGMGRDDGVQRIASVLETLRAERFATPSGPPISVTFSAGVAVFPEDATTVQGLCEAADHALYRAKQLGRDRVLTGHDRPLGEAVDVVVIDDDQVLVELLAHALSTRGYRWRHLADGQAAAEQLTGASPALQARVVLLDVDLPALNGLGVLRRMAEDGVLADTRVIMLTARSSEPEVVEALELGAFDHVAKPFSVRVLLERVRRALGS